MMKRIGRGLKGDEPSPGRIIYKGTHSHTQSYSNMSTSKFITCCPCYHSLSSYKRLDSAEMAQNLATDFEEIFRIPHQ